ncbi:MAG: preprotein translocase subunit SecG [Deltaproteobacteria bacterium]
MGIIIAIHVIVSVVLICLILIQRGRGGGFVDQFQGLETVFGTKTSAFLTKTTSVLAIVFFITCLSLAFWSLRQGRSLVGNVPVQKSPYTNSTSGREIPAQKPVTPEATPAPQSEQNQAAPAPAPAPQAQNSTAQ